jgi:hypothetical protein
MMVATKPKGSLKTFLDTKKVETRLVGPIERHLLTRPLDDSRRRDVIHPSELIKKDFCARASFFTITQNLVQGDRPGLRLQSIFDEGHTIHDKWQTWIREMGILYGVWFCMFCDHRFWDTSPTECPRCHDERFLVYKEVPLEVPELTISGHADGWIKEMGNEALIEIKSMGEGTIRMEQPSLLRDGADLNSAWRDIRRPFASHLRQGQMYLELLRRMVESGTMQGPAPTEIVYLYELKANQAYKEFVVKADTFIIKDELDLAFDITQALKAGVAPVCNVKEAGCKACSKIEVAA